MSIIQGTALKDELYAISQKFRDYSSVRTNKWKWYDNMLFDLENDPGEKTDVSKDHPEVVEFLENKLEEIVNSNKVKLKVEEKERKFYKIDETLRKRLKSLGYLQ